MCHHLNTESFGETTKGLLGRRTKTRTKCKDCGKELFTSVRNYNHEGVEVDHGFQNHVSGEFQAINGLRRLPSEFW